ncbi:EAL and HDOD domain-containing protein [Trinickia terrae]|nr:EAL domain-containing protein [Trinickia terrae]
MLRGFELLFRGDVENEADIEDADAATAQVIIRTIGEFGVRAALGGHKGYLNASRAMLLADAITLIRPDRFVFELPPDIEVDAALLGRIVQLHAKRYRFVLDEVVLPDATFAKLLPYVESVKVDFSRCSPELLPKLAKVLKSAGKLLIAMKIESKEAFEEAKELGFDLFQGYFFARPQMLTARRASAPRQALLNLLQLLSSDPSVAQLEAELKLSPVLVMHLMRLANSGENSIGRKAVTLRDAIVATGTNRITRWTQMLLYADGRKVPLEDDPLLQLAATRARFMELAVRRLPNANRQVTDAAFLTGVFSLVDAVFGDSLERTLEDLTLSRHIRSAILHREGSLGMLLSAVEALEHGDWAALDRACETLAPLTAAELAELALKAAAWASSSDHTEDSAGLERLEDHE